jgi:hypothetical protein
VIINEDEMGGACGMCEGRDCMQGFGGETQGK